ncbi:DUF4270 family protein [Dyadobacter pollutisoli]|uniref:DUF4270 family protein n=1 Tax=Dyadobacter pollutisoli TaxID=2910158 RepID=A0A9E8NFJ6_9BACT|nr:DUF4270 family protein [Dyadobacter pollutisoli]WAC13194.1 DUF4270 family protein [Dyadobacter pollutisoli]
MKFNSYSSKGYSAVYKLLLILGCTVSLASCEWGDQIESLVQPNPDDFAVLYTDTVTVKLSTVGSDSLMTGGSARMLTGSYTDPYFGKVKAASFFQPTIQSGISIPALAEYDSLVLSLRYDGYTYGDTTKPINLTVHKLLADILDKSSYWNGNSTAFDPVAIGKVRVVPTPRTSRNLKIKLSDALGQQMFEMGKNNQLTSNTDWINLVKGLVLMPAATDNGPVVGFLWSGNDSTSVQLHYHTPDVDQVKKDSSIFRVTASYNQILGDRKGTALANLPDTRRISLPSSQSGNMSFIQAGIGIMTRVDFPTVRSLKSFKYTVANRAYLRVTPLRASVTDPLRVPNQIYVYRCDKNNEFYTGEGGSPLPLYYLSNQPQQVFGQYVNDYVNNKQYYLIDVSSFISDLMTSEIEEIGGLILRTSMFNTQSSFRDADTEFSKSVNRLVIGNQQNEDPGVKLELYYTKVTVQ